jgi:hypothetical protein
MLTGARRSNAAYNVERRAYAHVGSNASVYRPLPTLPSSTNAYSNGHVAKKRRATTTGSSSKPLASSQYQSIPAPLPTPTSATHPPAAALAGPSKPKTDNTTSNNKRPASPAASLPPFTPPSANAASSTSHGIASLQFPSSPSFGFSPLHQVPSLAPTPTPAHQPRDGTVSALDRNMPTPYEQHHHQPQQHDHATPGAASTSAGSVHTVESDKDPFLTLLEQLAENEVNQGGPSELDFFLSGQSAAHL